MSKSKEKEKPKEAEPAKDKAEEKAKPDEVATQGKKRKTLLIAGIAGVLLACAGGGGFFAYKTFFAGNAQLSAKADPKKDGHSDSKDEHGDAKKDEHGDAKKDEHGDAKKDEHGDAKKDEHGDAKKDEHGDAKKDEHGDAKKDEHGDAKKDEHGAEATCKDEHGAEIKCKAEDGKKDAKSEEGAGGSFGETFELNRMDLNLGNPLENRYLRIAMSLLYKGGSTQKDELKKREPQIKDILITTVSSKTRLELLTDKGKDKLRRELLHKFNEVFERPIANLFFTDFLVE